MKLFTEYQLGNTTLQNRVVMAPMTRSRAIDNVPNDIMAEYYGLRADGGLLITEGVAPSPNGLGYPRIPGVFNEVQVAGWKKVADAVHAKGGKIFMQIMHTGRIGHPNNLPEGGEIVAPSAIVAKGEMWTDNEGLQPHPTPREMTVADIKQAIQEYVQAAENAIKAGLDGIELHGANGYLIDQFINPGSNQRTDDYGGSAENRNRFVVEVAAAVVAAIGADKVGIRLSPYGAFNDLFPFDGADEQYIQLAAELEKLNLVYVHLVNHSSMGAPEVPQTVIDGIRNAYSGTIIYSGGYDKQSAEAILEQDDKSIVAFGRPYLANPDLVTRLAEDAVLNEPKFDLFYTPGAEGYLDYPLLSAN
ncbi:MAG: alkene reductase [Flavipsychrobacter sp.]